MRHMQRQASILLGKVGDIDQRRTPTRWNQCAYVSRIHITSTDTMLSSARLNKARLDDIEKWQEELVANEKLPNNELIIWRNGEVAYHKRTGKLNDSTAVSDSPEDSPLYRYYSMTKPICSIGLMKLYEEGKFVLSDPVYLFLGDKWRKQNMRVYKSGDFKNGYSTVACKHHITFKMLLTHTSGLTYGFDRHGMENKVDEIYHKSRITGSAGKFDPEKDIDLATFIDNLSAMPLLFQPGEHYKYGYNTDVCGRLIEVLSGQSLDKYLTEKILIPCGMMDTAYVVPPEKVHRFSDLYMGKDAIPIIGLVRPPNRNSRGLVNITMRSDGGALPGGQYHAAHRKNRLFYGGSGLVGTASDYAKFCEMLMLGGRTREGRRIISNKTLEFMTCNHLEKDGVKVDMETIAVPGYVETTATAGTGFGLGFSCILDPVVTRQINSMGSFRWGGAASTTFWCDPTENLFVVFMTQLMFRNDLELPLTAILKQMVYGAIDESPSERNKNALLLSSQKCKL